MTRNYRLRTAVCNTVKQLSRETTVPKQNELESSDFPIETDKEKLRTRKGETIGSAASRPLAEHIADRLNEHADHEEEDRWSA
jgi:hypothetical protein